MKDFPVRPAVRQLQKIEAPGFTVALMEQPDLLVDCPYEVVMRSEIPALGIGAAALSYATKVEALEAYDGHIERWIRSLPPEQAHVVRIHTAREVW